MTSSIPRTLLATAAAVAFFAGHPAPAPAIAITPCPTSGLTTLWPQHPGPSDAIGYRARAPEVFEYAIGTRTLMSNATVIGSEVSIDLVVTDEPAAFPGYRRVNLNYREDETFGYIGPLAVGTYTVTSTVRVKDAGGQYASKCGSKTTSLVVAAQPGPVTLATVVEFYNAGLDHYFMTQDANEVRDLDSGVHAGWQRTGLSFNAYTPGDSDGRGSPVCRFYGLPYAGLNTHVYSASYHECSAIASTPTAAGYWRRETDGAFELALPDINTGVCPGTTVPVYRLWNARVDTNHRYTTSSTVKQAMIAAGYVAEGFGPDAVGMCAVP